MRLKKKYRVKFNYIINFTLYELSILAIVLSKNCLCSGFISINFKNQDRSYKINLLILLKKESAHPILDKFSTARSCVDIE